MPEILPAFDVFVLPSRYEGLPTAVVEAMVCGIPVVATAVNAVADVVVPGETGLLVPPRRPDLAADAVRYLLDRPAVAARMAVTARVQLGDRFGMPALRDALAAAYTGFGAGDPSAATQTEVAGRAQPITLGDNPDLASLAGPKPRRRCSYQRGSLDVPMHIVSGPLLQRTRWRNAMQTQIPVQGAR